MTRSILAEDPDAIVAPYLMSGGTDAKHFRKLGMRSYGFAPLRLPARPRLHRAVPRRRRAGAGRRPGVRRPGVRPVPRRRSRVAPIVRRLALRGSARGCAASVTKRIDREYRAAAVTIDGAIASRRSGMARTAGTRSRPPRVPASPGESIPTELPDDARAGERAMALLRGVDLSVTEDLLSASRAVDRWPAAGARHRLGGLPAHGVASSTGWPGVRDAAPARLRSAQAGSPPRRRRVLRRQAPPAHDVVRRPGHRSWTPRGRYRPLG